MKNTIIILLFIFNTSYSQIKWNPKIEIGIGQSGVRDFDLGFVRSATENGHILVNYLPKLATNINISNKINSNDTHSINLGFCVYYGGIDFKYIYNLQDERSGYTKFVFLGPTISYTPHLFKSKWMGNIGLSFKYKAYSSISGEKSDSIDIINILKSTGELSYAPIMINANLGLGYKTRKMEYWLKSGQSITSSYRTLDLFPKRVIYVRIAMVFNI